MMLQAAQDYNQLSRLTQPERTSLQQRSKCTCKLSKYRFWSIALRVGVLISFAMRTATKPRPTTAISASPSASPSAFACAAFRSSFFTLAARRGWASRPLFWNRKLSGYRLEVEHNADEIAKRGDKFSGVNGAAGDELRGGKSGQTNLLFGAQQDDVGQRSFNGVTDSSRSITTSQSTNRVCKCHNLSLDAYLASFCPSCCGTLRPAAQIPKMSRIDFEVSGKRSTQRLIGRYEGAQTLIDLAVFALSPLLNRLHCQQANTDPDYGDQDQPEQR